MNNMPCWVTDSNCHWLAFDAFALGMIVGGMLAMSMFCWFLKRK